MSSMWPLPSSVAGARMNSFTPKVTISSRTKLSQRSTSMRPCCSGMSAVAAEEAGVDRAHRRAADDVELDLPAQVAGQILADVAHDAGLVGAARAAAGQHQGDPGSVAASSGPRRRAHPSRSRVCVPRKRASSNSVDEEILCGDWPVGIGRRRAMKRTEWLRNPRIWSLAAAIAIPVAFMAPMIVFCPSGGTCQFSLNRIGGTDDWRHFATLWEAARVALRDFHQFPSWNPYHCGGIVLFQEPEAPFPGPLFLLTFFWLPTAVGMKLWIFAHLLAGTLGARALVADEGGGAPEQILGAARDGGLRLFRRAHRRRAPVVHALPVPAGDRRGRFGARWLRRRRIFATPSSPRRCWRRQCWRAGPTPRRLMAVALAAETLSRLGARGRSARVVADRTGHLAAGGAAGGGAPLASAGVPARAPAARAHRRLLANRRGVRLLDDAGARPRDAQPPLRLARVRRLRRGRPCRADAGGRRVGAVRAARRRRANGCAASIWPC